MPFSLAHSTEREIEIERARESASQRARESHIESLSLRICLQSPCLAHKALARLIAVLVRTRTLSWSACAVLILWVTQSKLTHFLQLIQVTQQTHDQCCTTFTGLVRFTGFVRSYVRAETYSTEYDLFTFCHNIRPLSLSSDFRTCALKCSSIHPSMARKGKWE